MRFLVTMIALLALDPGMAGKPFRFDEIGKFPSGLGYSVSLQQIPFVRTPRTEADDGSMWGIDGGYPSYVVKSLSVKFGVTDAVIHRKFVADISNIHSASVRASVRGSSNELVLRVKGGEAAGAFEGEFRFVDCLLTQRTIRMGEAPDEVWERLEVRQLEVEGCGRTRG